MTDEKSATELQKMQEEKRLKELAEMSIEVSHRRSGYDTGEYRKFETAIGKLCKEFGLDLERTSAGLAVKIVCAEFQFELKRRYGKWEWVDIDINENKSQ